MCLPKHNNLAENDLKYLVSIHFKYSWYENKEASYQSILITYLNFIECNEDNIFNLLLKWLQFTCRSIDLLGRGLRFGIHREKIGFSRLIEL
jgi:hypothetical protein